MDTAVETDMVRQERLQACISVFCVRCQLMASWACSRVHWSRLLSCVQETMLPVQLLALVLKHVHQYHRLRVCAAVSKAWRLAAAMATTSITVHRFPFISSRGHTVAAASWLAAHAQHAAIDRISIPYGGYADLLLPVQHLRVLRHLDLTAVVLRGAAVLPVELLSLTCLGLRDCSVKVSTLPVFQQLQHLLLGPASDPGPHPSQLPLHKDNVAALQQALPQLQHLTALQLHSV